MSSSSIPKPVPPTPEQLEWLKSEIGVIIHLDLQVFENTYKWREQWGYTPDPKVFNPSQLDTDQWLETAQKAGAKYAILVAKHCSGFSLWPTKAHDYSVANSPWRDGKGDLVAEFIASCKKYNIKPGLYCSASANAYMQVENPGRVVGGTDEDNQNYNDLVIEQLTELWTNYGPLFEVWFDGGVIPVEDGGPPVPALHAKLQPKALALNAPYGCHNRIRNSGAEDGTAILPAWSTANSQNPTRAGDPNGDEFMPIEADLANRDCQRSFLGGWFWHEGQDDTVHPTAVFVDCYYKSVGRNSNFLIGMVIDDRGLVPDVDRESFETFGNVIRRINAIPRDTAMGECKELEVEITKHDYASEVLIKEDISEGERVRKYRIQAFANNDWITVAEGEAIGHKRLIEFPKVKTTKIRLQVIDSIGTPRIDEFSVYYRLPLNKPPVVERDDDGIITISVPPDAEVRYTLDGSMPTANSALYTKPVQVLSSGVIRAITIPLDGVDEAFPELDTNLTTDLYFGTVSTNWQVVHADSEYDEQNKKENILLSNEFPWISGKEAEYPHDVIVDMQQPLDMKGFVYTPQWLPGHILKYEFYVGDTAEDVNTLVQSGSFPDIANMPVQQVVQFVKPATGRFFRFVATASAQDNKYASIGRLEITT